MRPSAYPPSVSTQFFVVLPMEAQEHDIYVYMRAFFEIPKFDQVIISPKVAQIGSVGS